MRKLLFFLLLLAGCSSDEAFRQFYASMHLNEGNRLLESGEYQTALDSFDKAVLLRPAGELKTEIFSRRGLANYALENYAETVQDMTAVIGENPNLDAAYVLRGLCLSLLSPGGMNPGALRDYNRALELNPSNARAHYYLGNLYSDRKQPLKAVEHYEQALLLGPDNADIRTRRADMELLIGMTEQALRNYTRALVLEPAHRAAYLGRARAYRESGNAVRAAEDTKRARILTLAEAKSHWKRAKMELSHGRTGEAVRFYTRSLDLDPTGASGSGVPGDAYFDRAVVFYYDRMYDRAALDFLEAAQRNGKNAKAYAYLGMCFSGFGDYARARTYLERSLKISPGDAIALHYLGQTLLAEGRPLDAVTALSRAINANPDLPDPRFARAEAFAFLQDYRKAVNDYNAAIDRGYAAARIYLRRGDAFYGLGLFDDAVADYTGFLNLTPPGQAHAGYLARADAFYDMRKYALAHRDYSLFLSVATNSPGAGYDRKTLDRVLTNMARCIAVVIHRRRI